MDGEKAMKRFCWTLAVFGLLFATLGLHGHAADVKKDTAKALMKKKLLHSQKVLEGIALHDFDKIAEHGEELLSISKRVEWKVLKTPRYETYSNQFRSNVEDLIKGARKNNVDSAALAYVDLTLTCVKCHKHVREKQKADRER
jgi:hypothetical protein